MNTLKAVLAFIFVSLLMIEQLPAQVDRSKQPGADPPPKASFPPYESFTLKNKLKVFLVKDDRPLVTFRLLIRGGNSRDGEHPSLADFAADLLTKGTSTLSAQAFAEKVDFVGANVNASSSSDAISVTAGGLKKHLPVIMKMFADAVKNPAYSTEEIEKYRQEQITGLTSAKARSEFLADYAINKLLYGQTPYGRMPSEESLMKVTQQMVRNYHDTYFVPNNASLAVVGNITKDELTKLLNEAFADWKPRDVPDLTVPKFPERKGRRVILVDRPTSVQSSIRVIGSGPMYRDADRPKTFVLNSIVGAGTGLGNRLTMNLRETHSYTYSPYSGFDANMYAGRWVAGADVRNSVTDSALTEMFNEIRRMQTEEVPADELERNVQSAVGSYLMSVSDPTTTAVRVQSVDFYGLPKNYYQTLVAKYSSTTARDVMALAKKYFNSDDLAVVVVGKASEVKEKLEKFGTVEVWDTDLNPVGSSGADIGMTAQEAWDKMLQAMGGKEKMREISTRRLTGKITANMGAQMVNGEVETIESSPNMYYSKIDLGVGKMERFVNGVRALEVRTVGGGGRSQEVELEGADKDRVIELSHILPEAYIDDMGVKLEARGAKEVAGKQTIIVHALYPKGGVVRYFIDRATFLPVRQEIEGGPTRNYEDWRPVEGVMMPYGISLEMGTTFPLKLRDVAYELNRPIENSTFK